MVMETIKLSQVQQPRLGFPQPKWFFFLSKGWLDSVLMETGLSLGEGKIERQF